MKWGKLWNEGWEFAKTGLDVEAERNSNAAEGKNGGKIKGKPGREAFSRVEIPHDWLIADSRNLYENSIGWYQKKAIFTNVESKQYFLRFDGVYMDSTVYVNGKKCGEWKYGYSAFSVNISEALTEGENEILVKVVHQSPNSRWYSGAGIFRNIWLQETEKIWLVQDGTYVSASPAQDMAAAEKIAAAEKEMPEKVAASEEADKSAAAAESWDVLVSTEIGISRELLPAESQAGALGKLPDITVGFEIYESCLNGKRDVSGDSDVYIDTQISHYEKEIAAGQERCAEGQVSLQRESVRQEETDVLGAALPAGSSIYQVQAGLKIKNPRLWSMESPSLYILKTTLYADKEPIQAEYVRFGLRTLKYCPETGFWLNGVRTKLKGVCEHHDLGFLGAAYNQVAMRRKFKILREMGVNAIRTAHNMQAAEFMDLADEMGMLVDCECFDMWEKSKSKFDYARFFKEWYQKDVASWIRRDRNHPCVIMWSIGNEIYDTHEGEDGLRITKDLCREVRRHDPKGQAPMTIGSNYMPWENAQKCADVVKLAGYNYAEKYYDGHHAKYPDWIIYGSETASTTQSRGVYHFPYSKRVLADVHMQCSALGNSSTSWGAVCSEYCVIAERDHDFSCGQFLWSGFDYIGEPTPYHTKNSYLGQIDTAGFPKDSYYIYRSEWKEAKEGELLHLFPYWDFNPGQTVDVRVTSNASFLELFVNGKSQGMQEIDHAHGEKLTGDWSVAYEPGEVCAVAYDKDHNILAKACRKSFKDPARIVCLPDRRSFWADGKDLIFLEISMEDEDGNPVENANNRVQITVEGCGKLAGTDNGDSTDYDSYKSGSRRLFSGKLLAVVQAGKCAGDVTVTIASFGLPEETIILRAKDLPEETIILPAGDLPEETIILPARDFGEYDIPIRKIELQNNGTRILTKENPTAELTARCYPASAPGQELLFSVVDDAGIPSNLAEITFDTSDQQTGHQKAVVTAKGDGGFRVRCMCKNGADHISLISQMDFEVQGMGPAYLDPYGFVNGGLYQYAKGTPGNGNEYGVATARDGETQVGYRNLDFGESGSDEITIPIFALSSEEYPIQIWEGMPEEEGSQMIADVIYQKPSRWNVYQEETYRLSEKLTGLTSICFVVNKKIHIKGFSFTRQDSAFDQIEAVSCKQVYGDSFRVEKDGIYDIGNNVTLEFGELDFGTDGAKGIVVCGNSPIPQNSINIHFENPSTGEVSRQLIEFTKSEGMEARTSSLEPVKGRAKVSFIFLPGSKFDFGWFRFI